VLEKLCCFFFVVDDLNIIKLDSLVRITKPANSIECLYRVSLVTKALGNNKSYRQHLTSVVEASHAHSIL
jgi:hypothetical protein